MDKLVQARPIQWKDLNIQDAILKEESCQDRWNKYFSTLRNAEKEQPSWLEHRICKFIMRSSLICSKLTGHLSTLEKIRKKECLLKVFPNGQSDRQMKSTL